MGCCGKRRTEWLNGGEVPSTRGRTKIADGHRRNDHQPGLFEYVGVQSLTVKGVHSGILYRFSFPGEKIEVLYEDTFALMAERDLRFVGPHRSHWARNSSE